MRVRKAVLPVAGLGTRFLPATKAIPKEMLPIVDVPTIQLVGEEALASGAAVVAPMEVAPGEEQVYGEVAGEPVGDEGRLVRVREMVEKPPPGNAPSRLAIIGRYVLPPSIWPVLERTAPGRGGEIQLTDA